VSTLRATLVLTNPNTTDTELATEMVASPYFVWRAGMAIVAPILTLHTLHPSDGSRPYDPNALPDINDPGTIGNLLWLARRMLNDPRLVVEPSGPPGAQWETVSGEGDIYTSASSEGRALAMLLAAGCEGVESLQEAAAEVELEQLALSFTPARDEDWS